MRKKCAHTDIVANFESEKFGNRRQPHLLNLANNCRQGGKQGTNLLIDQRSDQQDEQAKKEKRQYEHCDHRERSWHTQFLQAVGDSYLEAYLPIVRKRKSQAWSDREKQFQLYRRGRYVEFNLVYDRGTLFGLQSGGRTESILMSLPPLVRWEYDWKPEPGSAEAVLYDEYLAPRDWL